MRLIDADAHVTVQFFDAEYDEYSHIEMSVADALNFGTKEGCPQIIDAEPVRHGWWIRVPDYPGDEGNPAWDCSECNAMVSKQYNYCPRCGAKMLKEGKAINVH